MESSYQISRQVVASDAVQHREPKVRWSRLRDPGNVAVSHVVCIRRYVGVAWLSTLTRWEPPTDRRGPSLSRVMSNGGGQSRAVLFLSLATCLDSAMGSFSTPN